MMQDYGGSSAGNTRGLIEAAPSGGAPYVPTGPSSAGNTRGLIEAPLGAVVGLVVQRLPRGIPAASLKRHARGAGGGDYGGLPRGIPAASLKRRVDGGDWEIESDVFRGEYPRPH